MSNLRYCREEESKSSPAGLTFTGLLQVAFIVLKLCNVINWSWWWVLAPTWIPLAIVMLLLFTAIIVSHKY